MKPTWRSPSVEMGEAEVDRDAARLLLGPAVAVDAGQGQDQAGLAVVDVAGGADDGAAHHLPVRTSRAMRLIVAPSAELPKRASISFITGPIAAGPESPRSATSCLDRGADLPLVHLGRQVGGEDLGLGLLLGGQLLARRRCGTGPRPPRAA